MINQDNLTQLLIQLGFKSQGHTYNEGIKLDKDADGHHLTMLYDETWRDNPEKLNPYIAANFEAGLGTIPTELAELATPIQLIDILDFSRVNFEKQLSLVVKKSLEITSKWPIVKLGSVCTFEYGKPLPEEKRVQGIYPVMGSNGRIGFHNEFIVSGPAIIVGRKGSAGEVIWEENSCYPIDTTFYIQLKNKDITLKYLYLALGLLNLNKIRSGTGVPGLNRNDAYQKDVPLPTSDIQQKIVAECEAIDQDVNAAQQKIQNSNDQIEQLIRVTSDSVNTKKLSEICRMQAGKFVSASDIAEEKSDGLYPCFGGNGLRGYTKTFTHEGILPLIGRQGALCGNINMATGQFHATEHAVVVAPNADIDVHWLYYQLKALNLNQYATGVAQPGLSVKNILTVTTPVPPLPEQQRLVAEIEKLEQTIATAQAIITAAPAQKQAIMQKYL
ncbi:restriction endonuclease subunit S [Methylomonas rosea]|uniref:Restriction endonuclease subunit S n=1 Tax=Methylomonas rosea TaxID=2952227 RepID=A0ABT1TU31_9GAMM|nr:restriction endonuclease subunit S [Methylomonas sp. WSC-7]MCQ8118279.1 restriction endonuclease subunit S [Methylomonas sp. WSC-7]